MFPRRRVHDIRLGHLNRKRQSRNEVRPEVDDEDEQGVDAQGDAYGHVQEKRDQLRDYVREGELDSFLEVVEDQTSLRDFRGRD